MVEKACLKWMVEKAFHYVRLHLEGHIRSHNRTLGLHNTHGPMNPHAMSQIKESPTSEATANRVAPHIAANVELAANHISGPSTLSIPN